MRWADSWSRCAISSASCAWAAPNSEAMAWRRWSSGFDGSSDEASLACAATSSAVAAGAGPPMPFAQQQTMLAALVAVARPIRIGISLFELSRTLVKLML